MRIILIGSNGYIGQNLSLFLAEAGVHVSCYDIQEAAVSGELNERLTYASLDVTQSAALESIDWNADAVIYMAGITGTRVSIEKANLFSTVNEIGLLNVLSAINKSGHSPHFLFPSTRLVYKGRPGLLAEEDEKEFKTVYAMNKYSGENFLNIFGSFYGFRYSVFRICVPYGNLGSIPYSYGTIGFMLKQSQNGAITIYGDGSQRRTFTHVGDICAAFYSSIGCAASYGQVFNIGGEDFSLREVAGMIAQRTGCEVKSTEWPEVDLKLESGDTVFDARKIQSVLSFSNRYKLQTWINELIL